MLVSVLREAGGGCKTSRAALTAHSLGRENIMNYREPGGPGRTRRQREEQVGTWKKGEEPAGLGGSRRNLEESVGTREDEEEPGRTRWNKEEPGGTGK